MLRAALVGSALGTPAGLLFIAPHVSETLVKVVFAVSWASFGVLHLLKVRELLSIHGKSRTATRFDHVAGFSVGLCGGALVSSVTGVGVDMLLYMVLVLFCRADLRIAIPTSVVLMAFTSVVGIATQAGTGQLSDGVFLQWLAAAPVVAVGAPLGALVVDKLDRKYTLLGVSALCVAQFAWTMTHESDALGSVGIVWSTLAVVIASGLFVVLYRLGVKVSRLP